jgi:putative photosynthetic complex assembly protein 2
VSVGAGVAFGRALVGVTLFWWLATGLVFVAQRQGAVAAVAAVVATALAALGARLVRVHRDDRTVRGAERSFLGGALLWAWVSTTFFAGWLVGPPSVATGAPGSWPLALEAIQATVYSDVAGLAMLALAAVATGRGGNQVGLWTYMVFWGAQQSAKLNIFFGVANPGEVFFPAHLRFLTAYFGPRENQWLVWASLAALGASAVWAGWRAVGAADPYARTGRAILSVLVGLAALEHAVLALPLDLPLWELFLAWRGG